MAQTLFNQPHSARAAVAWQPNAGIAKKLSSRGYTTTRWSSDEPEQFADAVYPAKASGFSAAHYQPSKQPLSPQAQASLALLEGEQRNESLGEEKPTSVAAAQTNEHLPFVMDAYGATRKSKLRVDVDPSVVQRALVQAELAESLVVSPITSNETQTDPIVIHPDVFEPTDADIAKEEASSDPLDELWEANTAAAEARPAVAGGLLPEELNQREAQQFAQELAQAREEAAHQLAQAVEKAMQEGFAKGLEQGRAEGVAQGIEDGLQQGRQQGIEQGKAEGEEAARAAVAEEMAAQRVLFENAATELGALLQDPQQFFEPLKRLAVHIAEQVVVGELQTSSKAIERLVQRCLDELDHPVHGAVVLELNPEDKARLQAHGGELIQGIRLEAVPDMHMGSVRVFANDTVVEDLVLHRIEGLARALRVDVDAWRDQTSLVKRESEVQEELEDGDAHS